MAKEMRPGGGDGCHLGSNGNSTKTTERWGWVLTEMGKGGVRESHDDCEEGDRENILGLGLRLGDDI